MYPKRIYSEILFAVSISWRQPFLLIAFPFKCVHYSGSLFAIYMLEGKSFHLYFSYNERAWDNIKLNKPKFIKWEIYATMNQRSSLWYTDIWQSFSINSNFGCNSPMRTRTCQPTADLTSTCPQTEMNNHPGSLEVASCQQVMSPSCWWLSRPELLLQISSHLNSSQC